jgi:hypothetical protein
VQLDWIFSEKHNDGIEANSPCTPAADNACDQHLLRVIGYIGPDDIYRPPVMTIRALHNVRCGHVVLQRFQDHTEGVMHELTPKHTEEGICCILSCAWGKT